PPSSPATRASSGRSTTPSSRISSASPRTYSRKSWSRPASPRPSGGRRSPTRSTARRPRPSGRPEWRRAWARPPPPHSNVARWTWRPHLRSSPSPWTTSSIGRRRRAPGPRPTGEAPSAPMTARIRVESGGRVVPDAEASGDLDARHGSFVLLPTTPDLLAALRQPSEGGRGRASRVVLMGDASGFPLSDLIAFLSQSRWTGTLRLHAPGGERTVVLKDGEIRGASSEDPADRLSEVLVRLGHAGRPDVEEALRDNPPSRVGRALVDRGLLQPHDLWACITQQVSEIFHAIVLAREGAFTLVDQEHDDRSGPTVQLSTQSLLMDAIRKIDELQHFRQRIPHG